MVYSPPPAPPPMLKIPLQIPFLIKMSMGFLLDLTNGHGRNEKLASCIESKMKILILSKKLVRAICMMNTCIDFYCTLCL